MPAIEASPEIQGWLSQFSDSKQIIAKTLLSQLVFISRDDFSAWFSRAIASLPEGNSYALYAVRKLRSEAVSFWDDAGAAISRPGESLGSEDLVYSLIANVVRTDPTRFFDHPSLGVLRDRKAHHLVLIDDSIGSGDRVAGFINAMLNNPTFLSWWSYGLVKFHVLSYARTHESEKNIVLRIKGSDHGKRKYRKSSKVEFSSENVYSEKSLKSRWGTSYVDILELCRGQKGVRSWARLGYGKVMANIVFYHSVPNNLPGVVWFQCDKWNGLFPQRSLPDWVPQLLEGQQHTSAISLGAVTLPKDIVQLLLLIKRGIRRVESIALRMNCDQRYADALMEKAQTVGLLSNTNRLTKYGLDLLFKSRSQSGLPDWDRTLYIPTSWRTGQATVQPPVSEKCDFSWLADSVESSTSTDGDVGQASLERSDAKAATPPFRVMTQPPSESREGHDTDGPQGQKDR